MRTYVGGNEFSRPRSKGKIHCEHCNKTLYVSGSSNNKKVELYETSSFRKLKTGF